MFVWSHLMAKKKKTKMEKKIALSHFLEIQFI